VIADAGFASKENLRLIKEHDWRYVFGLARTWKFEDGTHLKDLANHLPRKRSQSRSLQPCPTAARVQRFHPSLFGI